MYKFYIIISKFACIFCIFAFFGGCDNQAEPPKATNVVSKKIVVSQSPAPAAPTPPAAATPSKPEPAAAAKPSTAVATPSIVQVVKHAAEPAARVLTDTPAPAKTDKVTAAPPPETSDQPTDATDQKPVTVSYLLTGIYDPAGKIDPFLPLYRDEPVAKATDTGKKKKIRRLPLTPLEKVDISQLKLVGVIRASSGNRALVEEATGKGYIVKQGTYIGINAGRVVNILTDRLIVEEEVETALGSYELQKRELKIQKPPGEM